MSITVCCAAPADYAIATAKLCWSRLGYYTVKVTVLDRFNELVDWTEGPFDRRMRVSEIRERVANRIRYSFGANAQVEWEGMG